MLLNEGTFNDQRYLKSKTIKLFTSYHSSISRRGYGFDKPEKENATRNQPTRHQSFSGNVWSYGMDRDLCWVDPKYKIIYIFLSNRVQSQVNNGKLSELSIRGKIQDAIYKALGI